eukprot:GFUD01079789.1.p1 GENE.GFUD01079789.1~~GFUD01079789.1.p1  ORF type:complete len:102 (+),score=1.81 GFUD01079789.1:3-308(+)
MYTCAWQIQIATLQLKTLNTVEDEGILTLSLTPHTLSQPILLTPDTLLLVKHYAKHLQGRVRLKTQTQTLRMAKHFAILHPIKSLDIYPLHIHHLLCPNEA